MRHCLTRPAASKFPTTTAKELLPVLLSTTFIIFCGASVTSAAEVSVGDLKLSNSCIRAMLPGAQVAGGYLTITNTGQTDDRLIAVSSERSSKAQIHEMAMDGNVMIMRELPEGLEIPAHESVKLAPGGYHLMLMDIAEPLKEGQVSKVTLNVEKSGPVEIEVIVGPVAGGCLRQPS